MKKLLVKINIALSAIAVAGSLSACSNEEDVNSNIINNRAEQQLTFTLTDEGYNADKEMSTTRSSKDVTLFKDTTNINNDIFAETVLERDTTLQNKPTTRTAGMGDGTYTILAYKDGTLKGTLKGTVTSNIFTATGPNQSLNLEPGTYTFYCCNNKVNINGNSLKVNRADAEFARIGITTKTITATPMKQKVDFQMKHVGGRVRVRIEGWMPFNASIQLKAKNAIPGSITLDATTGTYSLGDYLATNTILLSNSGYLNANTKRTGTPVYSTTCPDYVYVLPKTKIKDFLTRILSANIYKKSLSNIDIDPENYPYEIQQNGSYVLRVSLYYNFKGLYQDGTVWPICGPNSQGIGGTHGRLIGYVINDNTGTPYSGTAMSISDISFSTYPESDMPSNQNAGAPLNPNEDKQGYHWTWDADASSTGIPRTNGSAGTIMYLMGSNPLYGPYASATNVSKYYLPAAGEWIDACKKLMFAADSPTSPYQLWSTYSSYRETFNEIMTGLNPLEEWYWTSSTQYSHWVGICLGNNSSPVAGLATASLPGTGFGLMPTSLHVRPFIHF